MPLDVTRNVAYGAHGIPELPGSAAKPFGPQPYVVRLGDVDALNRGFDCRLIPEHSVSPSVLPTAPSSKPVPSTPHQCQRRSGSP